MSDTKATHMDALERGREIIRTTAVVYMTPVEVAEMIRVSPPTIYRWAAEDPTMPAVRYSKTLRFPRDRFMRWLRDREQGRGRTPPSAAGR